MFHGNIRGTLKSNCWQIEACIAVASLKLNYQFNSIVAMAIDNRYHGAQQDFLNIPLESVKY